MAKILCVDDDRRTLQTLFYLLDSQGFDFAGVDNAPEAEAILRAEPVDLVIVDHGLPGTDGGTLAHQFKQIKDVPVVMLTGRVETQKPEAVDLLLHKPQDPASLVAEIRKLIGS